ncbi:MAG: ATP-grasp domain-containing protein [Methanomassiliicoccaceae archaeon]|jgi:pyrrolysine biosynthesis protein PylC|nr:ATP-grasp domain-containing protein [Methanomassiliicoccaceae archaeon]
MKIGIIGGAMQGMEAAYLARKAGYETLVIDRARDAPAFSLADEYVVMDPTGHRDDAARLLGDCDAVLPACRDMNTLYRLYEALLRLDVPFLFDFDSYTITSSRSATNNLMGNIGIKTPKRWQECGYPKMVKPASRRPAAGLTVAHDEREVTNAIRKIIGAGDEPIVEEFTLGKNVSMEVIGNGEEFMPFVTTEFFLNERCDRKGVVCSPDILAGGMDKEFRDAVCKLAESIDLKALMEVKAVGTENELKVVELNACLPTETPTAVLAATGINMLSKMIDPRCDKNNGNAGAGASSYEHFMIADGKMTACGETEFRRIRYPHLERGMFGADEMIIGRTFDNGPLLCAMINAARDTDELDRKRAGCIESMMDEYRIDEFTDSGQSLFKKSL